MWNQVSFNDYKPKNEFNSASDDDSHASYNGTYESQVFQEFQAQHNDKYAFNNLKPLTPLSSFFHQHEQVNCNKNLYQQNWTPQQKPVSWLCLREN